jgi:hypothetical protein
MAKPYLSKFDLFMWKMEELNSERLEAKRKSLDDRAPKEIRQENEQKAADLEIKTRQAILDFVKEGAK